MDSGKTDGRSTTRPLGRRAALRLLAHLGACIRQTDRQTSRARTGEVLVERPDAAVVGAGRVQGDDGALGVVCAHAVQHSRAAGVAKVDRQVQLLASLLMCIFLGGRGRARG
jgi:hypothetical protein